MRLLTLWTLLQTEMSDVPTLSYNDQVVKSLLFHIPEARKKVPLSDGAPRGYYMVHCLTRA